MNRRSAATCMLASGLLAAGTAGAAIGGTKDAAVRLFLLSGSERQLASVGEAIARQFEVQSGELPVDLRAPMGRALRRAFEPPVLHKAAIHRIRKGIDDPRGDAAMKWLRSDLGRRITRLEEEASTPRAITAIEHFAIGLQGKPPSPMRVGLIQQLEAASHATDFTVDATLRTASAVARALAAAYPAAPSPGDHMADIQAHRSQLREQIRGVVLVSSLYTYRGLSDEEVSAYIRFMRSEPGRWYVSLLNEALGEAMDAGADRLDQSLRLELSQARSSSPPPP